MSFTAARARIVLPPSARPAHRLHGNRLVAGRTPGGCFAPGGRRGPPAPARPGPCERPARAAPVRSESLDRPARGRAAASGARRSSNVAQPPEVAGISCPRAPFMAWKRTKLSFLSTRTSDRAPPAPPPPHPPPLAPQPRCSLNGQRLTRWSSPLSSTICSMMPLPTSLPSTSQPGASFLSSRRRPRFLARESHLARSPSACPCR